MTGKLRHFIVSPLLGMERVHPYAVNVWRQETGDWRLGSTPIPSLQSLVSLLLTRHFAGAIRRLADVNVGL